jgi:hypothetical protein
LFIDDEPSKALWNLKWNELFLMPFRGCELSKNKVQWLDLAPWLCLLLKGFPFAKSIYAQFIVIMQFLKSPFNSWYPFYFWFKQFEGSSNGDLAILQLPSCDILSKP